MSIINNPVFHRELRGMRFWRGRFPLGVKIAIAFLFAAIALPWLVHAGAISGGMMLYSLRLWAMAIYIALPVLLSIALDSLLEHRSSSGEYDDLYLTLLQREEINIGTAWGIIFPVAIGCLLLVVGTTVALVLSGEGHFASKISLFLVWLLLTVSNLHFTLVMVTESREGKEGRSWITPMMPVAFSLLFDLMLFGFLFKPVFLLMNLTDSLTTRRREWFSRKPGPPPRFRSG